MALVSSTSSLGGLAGGNALARLLVVISGDASGLERAIAGAKGSVQGFGQQASAIGGQLSRTLTLPLLAIGGASVAMAAQFQQAMGRVAGLTSIFEKSGLTLEGVSQTILDMSRTVPTGPVELADALYFAGSAGLQAGEALQVVELAAKGSAIGMGQASDIAKVLIFSLNAFRSQGLSAAEAMDALTVAVREGTAEPEELAVALGRLLPVAKQAGITFQEVVGAVAGLTNIGFPARVATVALRALFAELLAPTQQATERLKTLGLTADDLRNSMRFGGPIAAFKLLSDAVDGDEDALRDILPQIRGFSAFVGITGDRLQKTIDIMDKATNSTGALDHAFQIISQTPTFKFEVGLNKLRVAAISLGNQIIPVLNKVSAVVGDVADRIADLPAPVQKALVAFLGLAAAIGPALKLLGNMGALTGGVVSGFGQVATTIAAMGVAAFVAFGAFKSLSEGSSSLFSILTSLAAGALAVYAAMRLLQGAAVAGLFATSAFGEALIGLSGGALTGIAIGVGALVTGIALLIGHANSLQVAVDQMGASMLDAAKSGDTLKNALKSISDEEIRTQLMELAEQFHLLGIATAEALPRLAAGIGDQLIGNMRALAQEATNVGDGFRGMGDVTPQNFTRLLQMTDIMDQAVESGQDLGRALREAGFSSQEFFDILGEFEQNPMLADEAHDVRLAAKEYGEITQVLRDYQQAQVDTIAIRAADQEAVDQYARELGVSSDFLRAHLDAVGVSALGMTAEGKTAFEALEFTVNEHSGAVSAQVAEMEASIAESAGNIAESISGAFAGFDKVEQKFKGTTANLLNIFRNNAQAIIRETANMRILAERGVPTDVLEFLAEQGPEMVGRFVDASDGELHRLVSLYQAQLAAVDSAIIQESLHQEKKGASMVGKFGSGILSNDSLPTAAARGIVQRTVDEFSRGDISEGGLHLALTFARGLGVVRGLSEQEGARALEAFITQIKQQDLTTVGAEQANNLANGLAQAAQIPRQKARELINTLISEADAASAELGPHAGKILALEYAEGINNGTGEVRAEGGSLAGAATSAAAAASHAALIVGIGFGTQFASGMLLQREAAAAAARSLAAAAAAGLEEGLRNSPKYFTYYAGQRLVDQLAGGIKSRHTPDIMIPQLKFPAGSAMQGRMGDRHRGNRHDRRLRADITIDRGNVLQEVDWEVRSDGYN